MSRQATIIHIDQYDSLKYDGEWFSNGIWAINMLEKFKTKNKEVNAHLENKTPFCRHVDKCEDWKHDNLIQDFIKTKIETCKQRKPLRKTNVCLGLGQLYLNTGNDVEPRLISLNPKYVKMIERLLPEGHWVQAKPTDPSMYFIDGELYALLMPLSLDQKDRDSLEQVYQASKRR